MKALKQLCSFQLVFPAELTVELVADVLRTLAAESRGGLLAPELPVVFETRLSRGSVVWLVSATPDRLRHLQASSDRVVPGWPGCRQIVRCFASGGRWSCESTRPSVCWIPTRSSQPWLDYSA